MASQRDDLNVLESGISGHRGNDFVQFRGVLSGSG